MELRVLHDEKFEFTTCKISDVATTGITNNPKQEKILMEVRGSKCANRPMNKWRTWKHYEYKGLLDKWLREYKQMVRVGVAHTLNHQKMINFIDDPRSQGKLAVGYDYHPKIAVDVPAEVIRPYRFELFGKDSELVQRELRRSTVGTHRMTD